MRASTDRYGKPNATLHCHLLLSVAFLFAASCQPAALAEDPESSQSIVARDVSTWLDTSIDKWVDFYRELHRHPELSGVEVETASRIATRWRDIGFAVTPKVGETGVVGILENGDGPTIMLRCDMDALPVHEQTGAEYQSKHSGVMHACGHDVHMTAVTAAGSYFAAHRDRWSGRLMLIAQPAEETGRGSMGMLRDGLFKRFKKPDAAIAFHVASHLPTGVIGYRVGYAQANVDSVDIVLYGRGGHGSKPHTTIDPISMAGQLIVSLQTIVSREIDPTEPAVVTVGSVRGGTRYNIIPDECRLQLTVRSYGPETRSKLLKAIQRKAEAVAHGGGAEAPSVTVSESTPSLLNDAELAAKIRPGFLEFIPPEKLIETPRSMGGEDFSRYGIAGVPILMFAVGSVDASILDGFEKSQRPPPSLHSSKYLPDAAATVRVATQALVVAATRAGLGETSQPDAS
ncbi:MAG: amidohydrolase [Planctomycetota bacterium]